MAISGRINGGGVAQSPTIFVSYSRAHSAIVSPLVKLLKLDGRNVFLDEITIAPGDDWEGAILDALNEARIVVILWCSHAKRSHWVRREWKLAVTLRKSVIPILLDTTPPPNELSRFQAINFAHVYPHVTLLRKIIRFVFHSLMLYFLLGIISWLSMLTAHAGPEGIPESVRIRDNRLLLIASIIAIIFMAYIFILIIAWFWRMYKHKIMNRNVANKVMEDIRQIDRKNSIS
jgi:hypothetical protein